MKGFGKGFMILGAAMALLAGNATAEQPDLKWAHVQHVITKAVADLEDLVVL